MKTKKSLFYITTIGICFYQKMHCQPAEAEMAGNLKMKYDTILFGNGLTLSLLNQISALPLLSESDKTLLNLNLFVTSFLNNPEKSISYDKHQAWFTDSFELKLGYSVQTKILAKKMKEFFSAELPMSNNDVIKEYGFEYWAGEHIFNTEFRSSFEILYSLNNLWYVIMNSRLAELEKKYPKIKKIIREKRKLVSQFSNICTLNFDQFFDSLPTAEKVAHLHGRFLDNITNFDDLVYFEFPDQKGRIEYPYLFGSSGFEKWCRLSRIYNVKGITNKYYDLRFLFDNEAQWGNILVFGISFLRSSLITEEFLNEYPQHRGTNPFSEVDSHILYRLKQLKQEGRVGEITLACWNANELSRYQAINDNYGLNAKIVVNKPLDYFVKQ